MAKVSSGPPKLAQRNTPHTDDWIEQIREVFSVTGSRSEFARFVEGADARHGKIVRWTNVIARWLNREALPSLESYFLVNDWLKRRKQAGRK